MSISRFLDPGPLCDPVVWLLSHACDRARKRLISSAQ